MAHLETADILQKFRHLDKASPEFLDDLETLFYTPQYESEVNAIEGDDAQWLIDFLDEVRDFAMPFVLASTWKTVPQS